MKPKKRQKICYNCDGEIDLEVIVCPYCAADLREEKPEQQRSPFNSEKSAGNQRTMESLYPAQFSSKPRAPEPEYEEPAPAPAASPEAALDETADRKPKNIFGPTLLFTLGVQLCLLGILMVLFSHKGVMILKWDARLWFIYVFASIPLLIFGYRSLSKL